MMGGVIMGLENYEYYMPGREIGLVYSPDDGGYYWQELFGDWAVSKLFKTKQEAMDANEEDMEWEY